MVADEALQTLEGARWRQSPGDFGIGGRYPVKEVFGAAAATWQGESPAEAAQLPCRPLFGTCLLSKSRCHDCTTQCRYAFLLLQGACGTVVGKYAAS